MQFPRQRWQPPHATFVFRVDMPLAQVSQHTAGVEHEIDGHVLSFRKSIVKVSHNRGGIEGWRNRWQYVEDRFSMQKNASGVCDRDVRREIMIALFFVVPHLPCAIC